MSGAPSKCLTSFDKNLMCTVWSTFPSFLTRLVGLEVFIMDTKNEEHNLTDFVHFLGLSISNLKKCFYDFMAKKNFF